MATINISNLTFAWDGKAENIFEGVSFTMDTSWRAGLIGRNGRGKTTLLRLLSGGSAMPHGGTISSPAGFRYFPYDTEEGSAQRTTMDVVYEVCPTCEFWELCREMNLLGVPEELLFRPFSTLSPGERTKILLATLFLGHGDFVLLDEPTNHLDEDGKRAVAGYLRTKRGFLVASHDRALLDAICDHIVSIGRTGVEVTGGNYSVRAEENRRRDSRNVAENERLAKDIRRMEVAAGRTARWSDKVESSKYGNGPVDRGYIGHKSAKLMKRAKSLQRRQQEAIEQKQGLLKEIETSGTLKLFPLSHHADILAEMKEVRIGYLPDKLVDLTVRSGERVALAGGNGSGKSSIMKLLAGLPIPHTGTVKTASGLTVSYIPQETSELSGDVRRFAATSGIDLTMFLSILTNFGLERSAFDIDIAGFSDGQKRKVLLAKSLCESAHLYLWDEPLNYIDIISSEQIEEAIIKYAPTMLFIEHDEVFAERIRTRVVEV
jgi:lincosamide and streptogramin A transport system ATP-binding/permease protein